MKTLEWRQLNIEHIDQLFIILNLNMFLHAVLRLCGCIHVSYIDMYLLNYVSRYLFRFNRKDPSTTSPESNWIFVIYLSCYFHPSCF